ncbi:MAG: hypothetical protein WBQ50_12250 [Nocardioides sp.]
MHRATALGVLLTAMVLVGTALPAQALPDFRDVPTRWENPRPATPTPRVVGLRWARHDHFDRVVVVLRGARPDYRTLFPDRLTYDPSGKPVPLRGRHRTYLVLRPAVTYGTAGESFYVGRRLVRPDLPALRGIALTGSWEGDTSFGFSSRTRHYRVLTLTRPSRVVIDFQHPGVSRP